jgi:actin-like ATPase involved in cell morphogenesis
MGQESQTDLAKELRLSPAAISSIVQKARKKPEAIREAIASRAEKLYEENTRADYIENFILENGQINNLKEIKDRYEEETQATTTIYKMRNTMVELLGMSYRKIIYQAVQANSERARVQR